MDVILLGEALAERALKCAQVCDGKLEDLRRLLARDEERGLGVLVLLRLALCHCALCASILGFSNSTISISIVVSLIICHIRTLTSTCWC